MIGKTASFGGNSSYGYPQGYMGQYGGANYGNMHHQGYMNGGIGTSIYQNRGGVSN